MIDAEQISTLLTVAETGSMTKSARHLNCTQPALSYRIKALIDAFLQNIERSPRGLRPTAAGEMVISAKQLQLAIERFTESLDRINTVKILYFSGRYACRLVRSLRR